uniref:LINE-1 reverse transcriptase n=1 Tax=Anthurium amnicola TaxID=1678845 RepID=A0A1D1ZGQ7_9ARAE
MSSNRLTSQGCEHLNQCFPVLLSTTKEAFDLKDCQPISLLNGTHKIIKKILTIKLGERVPRVIEDNKFAFIKGKICKDAFLMAHEAILSMKSSKKEGLVCKLDFNKAYDRVAW